MSTVTGSITFKSNDPKTNENNLQNLEQRFFTATIKNDSRPLSIASTQLNAFDNKCCSQDDDNKNNDDDNDNKEGYGTFNRKGPYIICHEDNIGHVCHRKYDEMATEL